jgi:hypothetical protein
MTTCCLNTSWSLVGMMMKGQRHLRPFCPKSKEEPMIEPQPVLPIDTHSLQPVPGAHVQQALITTDQL